MYRHIHAVHLKQMKTLASYDGQLLAPTGMIKITDCGWKNE